MIKISNPVYQFIDDTSPSISPIRKNIVIIKCLFCYLCLILSSYFCNFLSFTLYNSLIFISIIAIFTIIFMTASNKRISLLSAIILAISSGNIISCLIKLFDQNLPGFISIIFTPIFLSYFANFLLFSIGYKAKSNWITIIYLSIATLISFIIFLLVLSLLNPDYIPYLFVKGVWAIIITFFLSFIENYIFFSNFEDTNKYINKRIDHRFEDYIVYGIIFSFISIYVLLIVFIKSAISKILDK